MKNILKQFRKLNAPIRKMMQKDFKEFVKTRNLRNKAK